MVLFIFRFIVPSYVVLPTGRLFGAKYQNRQILIKSDIVDGMKVFSFSGPDLGWYHDRTRYIRLTFPAQKNFADGSVLIEPTDSDDLANISGTVVRQIKILRDSEPQGPFLGGVIDPHKCTVIDMIFEADDRFAEESGREEINGWATSALIWMVNSYRLATGDEEVAWPRGTDVPYCFSSHAKNYTFQPDALSYRADFFVPFQHNGTLHRNLANQIKLAKGDENLAALTPRLLSGLELEPHEQFFLDSVELLNLGNNPDLAIVVAETAFEVFLQRLLISAYSARGVIELGSGSKRNNTRDFIEGGNIKGDLLPLVNDLLSTPGAPFEIKSSSEFTAWDGHAYSIRNRIIHRGYRGSSHSQAVVAFNSINAFIEAIKRLLP